MLEVDLPPPGFIRSVGTVGTHVTWILVVTDALELAYNRLFCTSCNGRNARESMAKFFVSW